MTSVPSTHSPTASAVSVPLASSARGVEASRDSNVLTAPAAPHITSTANISQEEQAAVEEMEKKVKKLGDARQQLLDIRNQALTLGTANWGHVRRKIRKLTQAGTKKYHRKHSTHGGLLDNLGTHQQHILPTMQMLNLAQAHAAAETAINEIRAHHEEMMSVHRHLFKKEGKRFNKHRVYFPDGVTKVSLWGYDGKKKESRRGDGVIHHKIFDRKHDEDHILAAGNVDPLAVPPINGGRKTRKHRRKHKRKTRKHKRKRKTKKRKHHRRKHKRKTHRR